MEHLLHIFDWFLYILLSINVAYLLVYSLASLRRGKPLASVPARACKRFAVLIAAYREDAVILSTVHACLAQDYPDDKYDVTVISDHMRPETNAALSSLPIKLLQVDFEKSTNTKSLKAALEYLDKAAYDVALVIDADNIIAPSYLSEVNDAFAVPGVRVVQTHRVAKNLNTDMAYLDAVSEEINNSIFRSGHANLGMSAALIGSGMAFDYPLFYDAMMSNTSVGGFDRVLEMKLLYEGVHFHYLPDTFVKDEKIQQANSNAAAGCPRSITASLSLPDACCPPSVTGSGTSATSSTSKSRSPGCCCWDSCSSSPSRIPYARRHRPVSGGEYSSCCCRRWLSPFPASIGRGGC